MEEATTAGSYSFTYVAQPTSHAPSEWVFDLDYPMYGSVFLKHHGKKYSKRQVIAALKLIDAAKEA